MKWNLTEALTVCTMVEDIAPRFNAHVALTGGLLYKTGERKDLDLLFYGIRQTYGIDRDGLENALSLNGFTIGERFGWLTKAIYFDGKVVDLFFPELVPCTIQSENTNHYGV